MTVLTSTRVAASTSISSSNIVLMMATVSIDITGFLQNWPQLLASKDRLIDKGATGLCQVFIRDML